MTPWSPTPSIPPPRGLTGSDCRGKCHEEVVHNPIFQQHSHTGPSCCLGFSSPPRASSSSTNTVPSCHLLCWLTAYWHGCAPKFTPHEPSAIFTHEGRVLKTYHFNFPNTITGARRICVFLHWTLPPSVALSFTTALLPHGRQPHVRITAASVWLGLVHG